MGGRWALYKSHWLIFKTVYIYQELASYFIFLFTQKLASYIMLTSTSHFVQSVMPEDALLGAWKKSAHKLWVKRLRRTSSLSELLQVPYLLIVDNIFMFMN